jgi:type VI protein secretion system component VasF
MMRRPRYRQKSRVAWPTLLTLVIAVLIVAWILTQGSGKIWPAP